MGDRRSTNDVVFKRTEPEHRDGESSECQECDREGEASMNRRGQHPIDELDVDPVDEERCDVPNSWRRSPRHHFVTANATGTDKTSTPSRRKKNVGEEVQKLAPGNSGGRYDDR